MSEEPSAYTLKRGEPKMLEIPCQSCGKIVKVWAVDGIYSGCVFCADCRNGQGAYKYREQF